MKKNEGKVVAALLIIVLILLLVCAGAYGYMYITKLEDRINNLEQANNKTAVIEDTQSNNSTSSGQTENNTTTTFTNEEIKTAIQNYLHLEAARSGSRDGLLVYLGLMQYNSPVEHLDNNYEKTNIRFTDFRNKMLNYMTEEWLEKQFIKPGGREVFKDVDGYVCYEFGGASGLSIEVESIELKGEYSNSEYIAKTYVTEISDNKTLVNIEFHIDNVNNKCVISYCDW